MEKIEFNKTNIKEYAQILDNLSLHDYFISKLNYDYNSKTIEFKFNGYNDPKWDAHVKDILISKKVDVNVIDKWLIKYNYFICLKNIEFVKSYPELPMDALGKIIMPSFDYFTLDISYGKFEISDNLIKFQLELNCNSMICFQFYCESVEIIVP